jgi:hypothetical protein
MAGGRRVRVVPDAGRMTPPDRMWEKASHETHLDRIVGVRNRAV